MVGILNHVQPMFQTLPLGPQSSQNKPTQIIIALSVIFVPNREVQRLRGKLVWARFEGKLFVEHRIQVLPLYRRLVLAMVRIGLQMAGIKQDLLVNNSGDLRVVNYSLTNGSEKPLLSIGSKFEHLITPTSRARLFVL